MREDKREIYDMTNFTIRELTECGKVLRTIGAGAESMEDVADRTVKHLYEGLSDGKGGRACSLVRFYKTHPYRSLDDNLQGFVRTILGGETALPDMRCLVLLASAGESAHGAP